MTLQMKLSDYFLEGREAGRAEGLEEGKLCNMIELVRDGDLSIEKAAKKAGVTVKEFQAMVDDYQNE